MLIISRDHHHINWAEETKIAEALEGAEIIILGTAHKEYLDNIEKIGAASNLKGIMDACNIFKSEDFRDVKYNGIGRGTGGRRP